MDGFGAVDVWTAGCVRRERAREAVVAVAVAVAVDGQRDVDAAQDGPERSEVPQRASPLRQRDDDATSTKPASFLHLSRRRTRTEPGTFSFLVANVPQL